MRSPKVNLAVASGFAADWVERSGRTSSRSTAPAPAPAAVVRQPGGIPEEDEDVFEDQPAKTVAGVKLRRNALVAAEEPRGAQRAPSRPPSRSGSRAGSTGPVQCQPAQPASSKPARRGTCPSRTTKGPSIPQSHAAPVSSDVGSDQLCLRAHTVRATDLPAFARHDWAKLVLPLLYHYFFKSEKPFTDFSNGSDNLKATLQRIITVAFPRVEYTVGRGDSIQLIGYNRINECRSKVARDALAQVRAVANSFNDAQERLDWIRYATRVDGPLFWREPVPMHMTTDRDDPAYVAPGGRLLSPFIIEVGKSALRLQKGHIKNFNETPSHPYGLFGLIMAALERAIRLIGAGKDSEPGKDNEFSYESWGARVQVYIRVVKGIDESRWTELMTACGNASDNAELEAQSDFGGDLSLLDNDRGGIFDLSSPRKAS